MKVKMKKTQYIMGTEIEIIINPPLTPPLQEGDINEDIKTAFNIFYDYQNEFSRFDENSSLSQINKNKTGKISPNFIEVLELSKEIYKKTDGFFNPLVNISNIGYSSSFKENNFIKTNLKENLNLDEIIINGNNIFLKPNQNLDFGGIVKGFTVDKVAEFLESKNYDDFIINAGGDIWVTSPQPSPKGEGVTLAIDSPKNNGDIFALVDIKNMSLSTSGTYKRKWEIEGEKFHHIISPLSTEGFNPLNNEIKSISLIGNKTYITDAYATACIAMGIEKSLEFLKKEKITGVIIGNDDKIYEIGELNKYNFEII